MIYQLLNDTFAPSANDIIAVENPYYDSSNAYNKKFTRYQYRLIKSIDINGKYVEFDEPLNLPKSIYNIDLKKYERPNFFEDLIINSNIRSKIGNDYETKIVNSILTNYSFDVTTSFSMNIDSWTDLHKIVLDETKLSSIEFDLNFKKLFEYHSKPINGNLFFEKSTISGSTNLITYNNWEKVGSTFDKEDILEYTDEETLNGFSSILDNIILREKRY